MKRRNYFGMSAMLIGIFSLFLLAGCPQEPNPEPAPDPVYGMTVDKPETLVLIERPTGITGDIAADSVTITVTNTGDTPLKDLTVTLVSASDDESSDDYYDYEFFLLNDSMDPISLEEIPAGETATFTVGWVGPAGTEGKLWKARTVVKNDKAETSAAINIGVFDLEPTEFSVTGKDGVLVVGDSGVAISAGNAGTGGKPWLSTRPEIVSVDPETGALTIHRAGETLIGFFTSEKPLTLTGRELVVYRDTVPPVPVSAVINRPAPSVLELAFDKTVAFTGIEGFSISGSSTATQLVSASGNETNKMSFTLNQKPAYSETVTLTYDRNAGNVQLYDTDPEAEPLWVESFSKTITLDGFTEESDIPAVVTSAVINAAETAGGAFSAERARQLTLVFDKEVIASDVSGFSLSGSAFAKRVADVSGSGTTTLILTLNDWPSASESGELKIIYSRNGGALKDVLENIVNDFEKTVDMRNFGGNNNVDAAPPKIISVTVENNSPNTARVVFDKAVGLDASKFRIKTLFWTNANHSTFVPGAGEDKLDAGITPVPISSAVAADSGNKVWDFTLSAAARYGEILWLAADEGAAWNTAKQTAAIPAVPRFIVKNLVKRVKASYEADAGFYINGEAKISSADAEGSDLYAKAMTATYFGDRNPSHENNPKQGDVYTLVIDSDQRTGGNAAVYWSGNNAEALKDAPEGATIIITTTTANVNSAVPQDFKITLTRDDTYLYPPGNNHTLILDKHIIVEREVQSDTAAPTQLIWMRNGGKLILDGAELRGNRARANAANQNKSAAIYADSQTYGSVILINDGKITGNNLIDNHGMVRAGGAVYLLGYSVVVMHGGEITDNTLHLDPVAAVMLYGKGAAIAGLDTSTALSGSSHFFMTDGVIAGNKVTLGAGKMGNVTSTGGVLVSGNFQKTGGTIYGSTASDPALANTTGGGGNVKAGAVVVIKKPIPQGNHAVTDVFMRDGTTGPAEPLFADSARNGSDAVTVPEWAESYWDEQE